MQPKTVGVSLVVCWGVLIAIAFGYLPIKTSVYLLMMRCSPAFQKKWPALRSAHLLPENATGRLVNFWNPDCRCSRFSQAHIEEIMQAYAGQGIEFVGSAQAKLS